MLESSKVPALTRAIDILNLIARIGPCSAATIIPIRSSTDTNRGRISVLKNCPSTLHTNTHQMEAHIPQNDDYHLEYHEYPPVCALNTHRQQYTRGPSRYHSPQAAAPPPRSSSPPTPQTLHSHTLPLPPLSSRAPLFVNATPVSSHLP